MPPVYYHEGGFPPHDFDWPRLIPLIGPANAALARYDGILGSVANPALLLSPLSTQEAVLSSKIEGTQATMSEVLEFEADETAIDDPTGRKRGDIGEVLNYRRAMCHAVDLLRELPLCQRVLLKAHERLMEDVRGANRAPGEYRKVPNWIGQEGCPIEQARYVPISAGNLPEGMSRWEEFIHDEGTCGDSLVRLAVLHAEFEALHPFLDGNGRLGRMFLPLYLFKTGLLSSPMFYMSAYLESRREAYYEKLLAVSRDGDWTGWCEFFLGALASQAGENATKARAMMELHGRTVEQVVATTRSKHALRAVNELFQKPVFKASDFYGNSDIPRDTARRILTILRKNEIVVTIRSASGRRATVLAFRELLNTAEGREVF
jgi:Fic family protein